MAERRKAVRSRTLLGGVIAFNNHASTMDCQVRNFSPGGAKVTFANTAVVPDRFDLTIAHKERAFRARMIWREPEAAGVAFLSEFSGDAPVPLEWAKRLRDSKAETAALRRRIARLSRDV
jgi:hypothetical protein